MFHLLGTGVCPEGWVQDEYHQCLEKPDRNSDRADKDKGCPGSGQGVGNPCNAGTGNKYQAETDFSVAGLTLTRHYNSFDAQELRDNGFGIG